MTIIQARTLRPRLRGIGTVPMTSGLPMLRLPGGATLRDIGVAPGVASHITPQVQQQIEDAAAQHIAPLVHTTPGTLCDDGSPENRGMPPCPGGAGADADPTVATCDCYLQSVSDFATAAGAPLSAPEAAALRAQCVADVAAFASFIGDQGVNYDGCKPWYARRMTWYVGGGVALLGLVWWVLR